MGFLVLVAIFVFVVLPRLRARRRLGGHRLHRLELGPLPFVDAGWRRRDLMPRDYARVASPDALAPESPFDTLKRRYVNDEISVEDYEMELDKLYGRNG